MSQRRVPVDELVNAFEFEEAAKAALPATAFSTIAGSDRAALDRMTFRPRMNVPTLDLDLSLDLFGQRHFAPILVGPVSEQRRFHTDGELATVRGAAAARLITAALWPGPTRQRCRSVIRAPVASIRARMAS